MIYPSHFETKLGFDKIRIYLKNKCLSTLGEERVTEMAFSYDYDLILEELTQTKEFVHLLQEGDNFPSNFFFDVRSALLRIRVEGAYLDESELFDLRRSLETIRDIVAFLNREESQTLYPSLRKLAGDVLAFPDIVKQIDGILDKFGKIKDQASPELAKIRRDMIVTTGSISKSLNSILRFATSEGYVDKDVAPTMRDGRLVIPVSPMFKRKIKGIIHDESATGKTVYIEPAEVVEANNRIRELENEERREIVHILTNFSGMIRPMVQDIMNSYLFLSAIDFIRSKALFAIEVEAIMPIFENKQQIDWGRAIHPLLFLSLTKQGKRVIPLDIKLEEQQRILIISGPNAGGKSVCLKSVGLLQYMLQCGMLVPMHETSRTGIFERLFIDIGDEQSIENDLSTYSSHLQNMKFFVKNSQEKTLLLIDEFGTGTEPQIGGAIAEAVLNRLYENKAFGVITTHYRNLKHFADGHLGVKNGAMLYDRHEMRPLFQLEIGNPGSSFAIEIARKIGLPESVIQEATDYVGQDYIDLDKYLQDIVRDKRYWEGKRQNVRQKEKHLDELSAHYESELQLIDKQRKEILRQAHEEAKSLLSEANARIENTIREIKEAAAEKEKTREIRKKQNDFKDQLEHSILLEDSVVPKIRKIKEKGKNSQKGQSLSAEIDNQPIVSGDNVRIKGQTSVGQVMSVSGKNAQVAFGSIKSSVALERLEKVSNRTLRKENKTTSFVSQNTADSIYQKRLNFKQEIDVRGMRGEEAMHAVTYFIDDAILVGVAQVRILHGTGSGALRQMIRNYLQTISGVKRFHDERVQLGGTGITVVEF